MRSVRDTSGAPSPEILAATSSTSEILAKNCIVLIQEYQGKGNSTDASEILVVPPAHTSKTLHTAKMLVVLVKSSGTHCTISIKFKNIKERETPRMCQILVPKVKLSTFARGQIVLSPS